MRHLVIFIFRFIPDIFYTKLLFLFKQRKFLNLSNPKTFNEKINYIKLFSTNQLRVLVSDRLEVRKYVAERTHSCNLIPLLWSGVDFSREVYDKLPQKFVIKGNHGSKMVKIVDKHVDRYNDVLEFTKRWMKTDYYLRGRERNYRDLKRFLVVEAMLETKESTIPPDFKFFCFDGKVGFVQVDLDRFKQHRRNIYDTSFELLDFELHFAKGDPIKKPVQWEIALGVAEALSADFSFIRVDLFLVDGGVYFGELTNYPGNGLEKFNPGKFDRIFGDMISDLN
ncbi:Glycosyltransferase [Lunatimonas lonarensis]|uniref:Glycosyltransferase n=1 Tax=Lunatimonas lonarensis TaxID=1232681 RepID=R7ZTX5_9BACT|nr:ATP-grasp fold amidoligase family protein [Lunatimonas lonarensis]EON77498.1 Glycosyltransferase [Lunatimonas lonarensis]